MNDRLKDSWAPEGPVSKTIKERIQILLNILNKTNIISFSDLSFF